MQAAFGARIRLPPQFSYRPFPAVCEWRAAQSRHSGRVFGKRSAPCAETHQVRLKHGSVGETLQARAMEWNQGPGLWDGVPLLQAGQQPLARQPQHIVEIT